MAKDRLMSIKQYADSKRYRGKRISTTHVWKLINDGKLILAREKPAMVFAKKIPKAIKRSN